MQTHDLPGDYYWGRLKFPKGAGADRPRIEVSKSSEVEYPHRFGVGIAIRLTKRWSVVIGQWVKRARTEAEVTEHLERAVLVDTFDIEEPDERVMAPLGFDAMGDTERPIGEW